MRGRRGAVRSAVKAREQFSGGIVLRVEKTRQRDVESKNRFVRCVQEGGSGVITIFLRILSVFSMIGLGFAANRLKLLPKESTPYLISLLMNITAPFMILGSMGGKVLTPTLFRDTMHMLLAAVISVAVTVALSYLFIRPLRYRPKEDAGMLMVTMCSTNTGFMGFPIARAIFGEKVFFMIVIANLVQNFYLWGISVIHMNYGSKGGFDKSEMKSALLSAPMLVMPIGAALLFCPAKLPGGVIDFFNTIGDSTVPLSMIIIGVQLGQSHVRSILKNYKLVIAALIKLIVMPAVLFLVMLPLPFSNLVKLSVVFLNLLPNAVASSAMAEKYHKNYVLMAESITLTTLLSLATIPIGAMLLSSYFGV